MGYLGFDFNHCAERAHFAFSLNDRAHLKRTLENLGCFSEDKGTFDQGGYFHSFSISNLDQFLQLRGMALEEH